MAIDVRSYPNGSWVSQRYPFGFYVQARALCADGKLRRTKHLASTADTFFSVPASVEVQGKTVSGYISVDEEGVRFRAYTYGKNGHLLPEPEPVTR